MKANHTKFIGMAGLIALAVATPAYAVDPGWEAKVIKLVTANYTYPRSAEVRHEQGRAVVKIIISAAGKPVSVELIQSTGSQILDREAVRIPMKVGTFPLPPGGANASIVVPIKWQIS